ncbi:MAG: hypothetical protein LBI53_03565 [Candidatus Peribacteria bacterium]|jgi:hypothetical protein|nr:hypothetical protein [Candidatus Peribacteria bacterium]
MTTTFNEAERTVSIKGEDIEIKKEDLPLLEKFTQLIQKAPINADKARLERWAKQNDLPQDFIGKIL